MVTCNILKVEINYDIIDKSMNVYSYQNEGKKPQYIIINQNTLDKIKKYDCNEPEFYFKENYPTYHGIPIAICNKLEDGDIDIV